jgi:hypothetical protein
MHKDRRLHAEDANVNGRVGDERPLSYSHVACATVIIRILSFVSFVELAISGDRYCGPSLE